MNIHGRRDRRYSAKPQAARRRSRVPVERRYHWDDRTKTFDFGKELRELYTAKRALTTMHSRATRLTKGRTKSKKPKTVDEYVVAQTGEALVALQALVRSTLPRSDERLKWGVPAYFGREDGPICYLYAGRDHVNLGFIRGAQLHDPKGLLEGQGKEGRHIKVFAVDEIPKTAIRALLRAARRLAHE